MDFLLKSPASRLHRADDNEFHYASPPLEGSLTVSELYDFHYSHNPDHPVFLYSDGGKIRHIRFREVVPAAYTAARLIGKALGIDVDAGQRLSTTVAVLSQTDTITSFTAVIGMLRVDITFFMICHTHSPASVAHLLRKTSASHLLISPEPQLLELAEAAIKEMDGGPAPVLCNMPTYDDMYNSETRFTALQCDPRRKDLSATRYVLHSSGSTSLPKPIPWNDRAFLQVATTPLFGERDLLGQVFGCFGMLMYNGAGLNFVAWLAATGLIMATFPPAAVGVVSTGKSVWNAVLETNPSFIFAGPITIEEWSKDAEKVTFLKQLKGGLIFAGAPLRKSIGDFLAEKGCPLLSLYGSTEVGAYSLMFPDNLGMDWDYVKLNPQCALEFASRGDGTFEVIVVARPTTELTTINSAFNGEPAFATNDLVEPHPTLPNRWKYLGRIDDEIVLNNGEKTTPGPLEEILCRDPHVRAAVMFGTGKSINGVLIEVRQQYAFDPRSRTELEAFRDLIWPTIDDVNAFAPSYSRLQRELVIFATSEKPFQYSTKGQPKRKPILQAYSQEIEEVYATIERESHAMS